MKILGHNYTGGTRRGESGVYLHSYDATSGERLPYDFVQASPAEVDAAALAAASAYPTFRALPAVKRAAFLDAIADELDALGDDFVSLVTRETALPAARSIAGFVPAAAGGNAQGQQAAGQQQAQGGEAERMTWRHGDMRPATGRASS